MIVLLLLKTLQWLHSVFSQRSCSWQPCLTWLHAVCLILSPAPLLSHLQVWPQPQLGFLLFLNMLTLLSFGTVTLVLSVWNIFPEIPVAYSIISFNFYIESYSWLHRAACGILVPPPGINQTVLLCWEFGVFTTGPPGKSHHHFFTSCFTCDLSRGLPRHVK